MTKLLDLEQNIMSCWNVVGDLREVQKALSESADPVSDEVMNALLGLETLYGFKFQNLFAAFEAALADTNASHLDSNCQEDTFDDEW